MDERKQEILDWLEKLGQYAGDNAMPSRITDGIQDCKEKIASDNMEPDRLQTEVEGLLDSIRRKTETESAGGYTADSSVAVQNVMRQMQKMAERCHDDNERSIQDLSERKNMVLTKCEDQLKEILCVHAHMEEVTHAARYIQFYEKTASGLEKETANFLSELFEVMDKNYTHMMNHIRSLFRSLSGSGSDSVREKALYELDSKREGIGRKVLAEAESWKTGKQELVSFAQRTWKKISKIVKTIEIKQKLYAALPVFLVLTLVVGNRVLGVMEAFYELKKAEIEVTEKEAQYGLLSNVMELGEDALKGTELVTNLMGTVELLLFGIAGIMIVIFLYRSYLKWIRACCDRSIAKKCTEYLQKEFVSFEQSNCMSRALDEDIKLAVEEYEQQHLQLFHEVFVLWDSGQTSQKERFDELITIWNNIR